MKRKTTGIVAFTILALSQNMHGEGFFDSYKQAAFGFFKKHKSDIIKTACANGITGVLIGTLHVYRINNLQKTIELLNKRDEFLPKKKYSTRNSSKIATTKVSTQITDNKSLKNKKRILHLKEQNKQFQKAFETTIKTLEAKTKKIVKKAVSKAVKDTVLEMNTLTTSCFINKIANLLNPKSKLYKSLKKNNGIAIISQSVLQSFVTNYNFEKSAYTKVLFKKYSDI